MKRALAIAGLCLIATLSAAGPSSAAAARCDRACLTRVTDRYLEALAAHDPKRAPVAADVRFTEDGAPMQIGDGLWRTISGLGSFRLDFADPVTGSVGALALVDENGNPALMALRMKVAAGKISEVETVLARKGELQSLKTDLLDKPLPILTEDVPAASRSSRTELVRIVNSYFDAIEHGDGSLVPFAADGFRIENGVRTCNNPVQSNNGLGGDFAKLGAMKCADQLSTKIFTYIQSIRPRRMVVVDEQRGLVLGIFRFNHPGDVPYVDTPGFGRVSMANNPWAARPTSALIAELFKIQDHKVQRVMAVITNVPYRMPTGWER
jgi:hypothetical protein